LEDKGTTYTNILCCEGIPILIYKTKVLIKLSQHNGGDILVDKFTVYCLCFSHAIIWELGSVSKGCWDFRNKIINVGKLRGLMSSDSGYNGE
jgi:hypothetical protein